MVRGVIWENPVLEKTRGSSDPLVLENRHTGERLELLRVRREGEVCLELRGTLPPHSEGPPLHIHVAEDERGTVNAGVLSAVVDGKRVDAGKGDAVQLPRGSAHRWWNEGEEQLEFVGYACPVIDLDRYLQAVFEVVNAGPPNRPSLVYMAHALLRHRRTQRVLFMPRPVQVVVFGVAALVGLVLGKYRGTDWPGCPDRCAGAPLVSE